MIGSALIAGAMVTGLVATVLLFRGYLRRNNDYVTVIAPLIGATAGLLTLALGYLTYQFVVTDYANAYVWNNTANYIPLLYRITGVYAGNEGSVLLWAALAAVVAFWAAVRRGVASPDAKLVQGLTVGIVTYFAAMLFFDSPFTSITDEFPEMGEGVTPLDGTGLNPLLVDPYMAIHPPVMFIAYALLTMPFAIAVAHFISTIRGNGGLFSDWIGSITRWLRISWLFLTAAIVLGSLWSYRVLGWGGIWAWDPVETAVLIPWIFLTATLHAVMNYRSRSTYATLAPAMTATTLALVIYATAIVRSGVFRSVHSFADDGIGFALLVLLAVTTILGVCLPLGYWLLREPAEPADDSQPWLTRANVLHLAILGIGLLGFVSVWGLSFPVLNSYITGMEVEVTGDYYNLWSYPIVLAMLLLLGFYMDYDVEGRRRALLSLGVFTTATVLAALIAPTDSWLLASDTNDALFYQLIGSVSALSLLPPAAYVCLTVINRALEYVPGSPSRNYQFKQVGVAMVHIGFVILVVAVAFSYLFTAQSSVIIADAEQEAALDDSGVHDVPDSAYAVEVTDYREYQRPEDPDIRNVAFSVDEVTARGDSIHETVQPVYGTVTEVNQGPEATIVQLDDSQIWLGVVGDGQADVDVSEGDQVVGVGYVMWDYLPELSQTDAVVVTDPADIGSVTNPPAALDQTRVQGSAVGLTVYDGGERLASGEAGQERYLRQGGMEVRNVFVDRGLAHDTYVIAAVDDGTASLTIRQIPLMNLMRVSTGVLLAGMLVIILFDPAYGLVRTWSRRTEQPNTTETPSDD
ncbi:cytochrome c biogenesis protein CcsA [Natronorubrum thiooxidans]|uniref:Cytochrome c-type biogenesis protein CcmF n=1 Tax=Natronorubrum thiooxidans TaxID=308853 RepID=A0A1N7CPJ8_9EURY|nr:cytochrome c biogenesis protein CcsA [Natronorubrum thiooxidans]SIR65480.1 cytochrome c-type biogenesis protein CcmF [Natronorubrum thiooxidans]